jgi:hypothetical protein
MDGFVELIDLASGNVVGNFDDLDSALALLRATIDDGGDEAIAELALMRIAGEEQTLIAMQHELVELVKRHPIHS